MANRLNVSLVLDTSAFDRSLRTISQNLDQMAKTLTQTGTALTQNLTVPIAGMGAAALKAFSDMEKLEKGLGAVMGGSEAAAIELENLKEAARAPGLGFEEAVRGSIRLQAVGLSADEARGTLQAFGAAIAATGGTAQNLDSVQYQLTQMISKNRILQEDFGILQENVPLLGKAVEQAFGTANIEQIRATGISAQDFNKRLVEALQSLPEVQKATGGLRNAFDNFTDSVKFSLSELGRIIAETINLEGILNGLSDALASVVGWFKELSPGAQKFVVVIAAIVAAIGPSLFVVAKLAELLSTLSAGFRALISLGPKLGAAFTIATGPIGLTVIAIIGAIVAVAALYKEFEGVRRVVNGLGQAFIEFAKLAKNSFSALLQGFALLKEGDFKGAANQFAKSLQVLNPIEQGKAFARGFAKGFEDTTDYLTPTVEKVKKQIQDVQKNIFGTGTTTALPGIGGGVGGIREKVITPIKIQPLQELQTGATILQKYGDEIQNVANRNSSLAKTFDELGIKVKTSADVGLTSFGQKLEDLKRRIQDFQQGAATILEQGFENLAASFGEFLGTIGTEQFKVSNLFASLLGTIADVLIQLGKLAIATGIAVEGIKKALQTLNPIAAIAGGTALIALGAFVKAKAAGLTKLAQGGFVTSQTLAVIGDNPSGKEAVIPFERMGEFLNMFQPQGGYIAETRISGEDLLILVNRAEKRTSRYR